ncbi:C4-dicarboxylate ABC transporter permease [Siccirubricoccus deserti]|uniref:TRAP transporter large permease protein n=1 Tax=Siccirubricoccus deserti TaxID=2013562 RepID=A0A9X0QWC5_9PROT|nr:TRAP transporter large permease subunit [Siccirubricoccus deserti]MBC4015126.1 TRAP transporter large permease subunit [Siccirubricoccus deserti]GGC38759.1 C4-dicarboxylate ABC transporter permease [Siccirubricoccus deserti]
MDLLTLALLLLVLLCLLLGAGLWIAMSLAAVGYVAMVMVHPSPGLFLASAFWESTGSWTLAALPMFVWMGEILFRTRLSEELFNGLAPWMRRIPGRLLHVNILACGIFGAVSGSSAATCATISKIALPELKRRGYDERTAIGSLATSGTLGILIPPSIIMVVYAVAAEVSIIRVFIAGFIPGAIVMGLFSAYIVVWALLNPSKQPAPEPRQSFGMKLRQSAQLIPCMLLIAGVIGSMIFGLATATEAAAFGVFGSLVMAGLTGTLTVRNFLDSLTAATRTSCMIMFILAGAAFLTKAMALTGIPAALAQSVVALDLGPYGLIAILTLVYILLGTALDGVSMIVLTTSIVIPLVQAAGFDLVWFGIFIVLLVELAQITPPVGFNLFVMQTMTGKEQMEVAFASLPFFLMLVVAVALCTVFPVTLVTGLPDYLLSR